MLKKDWDIPEASNKNQLNDHKVKSKELKEDVQEQKQRHVRKNLIPSKDKQERKSIFSRGDSGSSKLVLSRRRIKFDSPN